MSDTDSPWIIEEICVPDFPFGRGYTVVHRDDRSSLGTFRDRAGAEYWAWRADA